MGRAAALTFGLLLAAAAAAQQGTIEATTADGEKVRLLPNGRWEYADPKKAEPQRKAREAEDERERGAQGGWLGVGRKIYPGDKDYNRGSLGRKTQ
ncbi:MAG TPA: hypothetical protein VMI15_09110 [Burkholderiales bacterium]|nr:hypothetical protein [Burkholderiales bacterium]